MPPIQGCINSIIVLQDSVFGNMTQEQWEVTLNSKVQSSWNLHQILPQKLDFFVLLSSLSGIYGSLAQSNYSAGCTYQDALASYRVARGQKAVSFDLGWMRNIGIIAENAAYQQNRRSASDMMPIEDTELLALLDIYCNPVCPQTEFLPEQLLVRATTPIDCLLRGVPLPSLALRPLFAKFITPVGQGQGAKSATRIVN